ncbi:MAG: S8 family serine peptidase [Beijerinckiaceae bacterium]|nr:S8 family serine peptidase [Beijerinckiaceae bacterium]
MTGKRGSVSLLALLGWALGGMVPAFAMPVPHEMPGGLLVEAVQFNGRVRPQMPTGVDGGGRSPGGGGRFPGGGGIFIDPGLLIGPLVEPPRGRRVIIEEYDDDEEELRPRPRAKRPPAQRAAPPRQPPRQQQARPAAPRLPPVSVPRANERRYVADEVLLELRAGADNAAVMRRHRLTPLSTTRFALANATIIRARVEGGRNARQVLQQMAGDARIASAQPNYLYTLQEEPAKPAENAAPEAQKASIAAPPAEPPPAPKPQYVLDRMAIADAHRLAQGAKVKVALIDTGLDDAHPELQGVIAAKFDALGTDSTGSLDHGTALAGAIVAKSTLRGVSPGAELLAARAFGGAAPTAQGTSFNILQALDWSAEQGARVFNLSFAGPQDRLMARTLEGAQAKKIIAIAAVGNAGPGTAPLYPAAEPSVLAVTATDASDAVFNRANTGRQVAIAAPGVDVIAAAPERNYAFSSGTSIAAAHVSGLVALMLEKNPGLDLPGVRRLLAATAQDLGPKGNDPVFGAGRVNAAAAVARAAEEAAKRP